MLAFRADEARWCAMLSGQIKRLGGTPSRKTGGFYAKALAISGALDRLAFLNRGQGWIVRKLEALTPRIRDEVLYADLRAILDSHRTNIDRACALLDLRRSEEHTSELQSLMRNSYAVFCLNKKTNTVTC